MITHQSRRSHWFGSCPTRTARLLCLYRATSRRLVCHIVATTENTRPKSNYSLNTSTVRPCRRSMSFAIAKTVVCHLLRLGLGLGSVLSLYRVWTKLPERIGLTRWLVEFRWRKFGIWTRDLGSRGLQMSQLGVWKGPFGLWMESRGKEWKGRRLSTFWTDRHKEEFDWMLRSRTKQWKLGSSFFYYF